MFAKMQTSVLLSDGWFMCCLHMLSSLKSIFRIITSPRPTCVQCKVNKVKAFLFKRFQCCKIRVPAIKQVLQVLRQAEVAFERVIYGEADGSRWHNFQVVQAEAGKECTRPLLSHYQPQALQR